uniref:SRCR domain-containing protein n=1 Tax=Stegastes partitus TaxID=144197 RepID=A0A3B5A0U9_9TELE
FIGVLGNSRLKDKHGLYEWMEPFIHGCTYETTRLALDHVFRDSFRHSVEMRPDSKKILLLGIHLNVSSVVSEYVRLVNGTSLCSGRLEVKFDQWSSVCEADFDLQDAAVVCRELGCGAPSVLWRALYGGVEAPWWTKEFQCGGQEAALMDCTSSASAGNTSSPGRAAGLTCSEPVRLVGGASRCAGALQVKLAEWKMVDASDWSPKAAAAACREMNCGSAVLTRSHSESSECPVWSVNSDCVEAGWRLRECSTLSMSSSIVELVCSGQCFFFSHCFHLQSAAFTEQQLPVTPPPETASVCMFTTSALL